MKKIITGILLSVALNLSATITLDGVDINMIANRVISIPTKNQTVFFTFKYNNLQTYYSPLEDSYCLSGALRLQRELMEHTSYACYSTNNIYGNNIVKNEHISTSKYIFLGAKKGILNINNSFLDSQVIILSADYCDLSTCEIKACSICEIKAVSPEALIQSIRITFNGDTSIPHMIEGCINLKMGDISSDNFSIYGAESIEIQFHEKAFK